MTLKRRSHQNNIEGEIQAECDVNVKKGLQMSSGNIIIAKYFCPSLAVCVFAPAF